MHEFFLAQGGGRPIFEWRWVERNADNIVQRLGEHVSLTATALGIGLVASIGLATLSLRWRWFYGIALSAAGALYVIPSLGAFAAYAGCCLTAARLLEAVKSFASQWFRW